MQNNWIKKTYHKLHLEPVVGFIRHFFRPTGFLRNFVFFPMGVLARRLGVLSKDDKALLALKGSCKGRRVFILGTGPSLRLEDIERLSNEDTIGLNTIYTIYNRTSWRPRYYMMAEYGGLKILSKAGDFANMNDFAKDRIFMNYLMRKELRFEKSVFFHYCWLDHYYNYGSLKWKEQANMLLGCYDFYSMTPVAVLMAIYLGYDEIYLLGVDCNYAGDKLNFERPDALKKFQFSKDMALRTNYLQNEGYKALNEVVKHQGVKVFNATRGGLLEVFPRVNFDDLNLK